MRIIYYTQAFFSDCDFPLIREFQQKGMDMRVYIPIQTFRRRSGIIDIQNLKKNIGIYKASVYKDLEIYKDYVNLDKIYIINLPDNRGSVQDRLIWLWVYLHMLTFRADIFHFNWQLSGRERWLYHLPITKYMTVHDPIAHSSHDDEGNELARKMAFKKVKRFILLSDVQERDFALKYNVPDEKIDIARMGEFSHLRYLKSAGTIVKYQYILFFGQILSYKGIEYLCEAMSRVHEKYSNLHLIIAGRGEMYFDYSRYAGLDYIHLKNDFIPIADLAMLIRNALFVVCPYKDATQSGVVQTAFSCNTPIIVTNVGALPKAVMHEKTGLVIPPCDVDALTNAIMDLATHQEKIDQFKKNIDVLWRPSMVWSPIAEIYINAYCKCCKDEKNR